MNKKSLRYLIPLTLILSLLLSVTAFADTSSPTASQNICVDLEGARAGVANGEPISLELSQSGTPEANSPYSITTDEMGCFEVPAVGVGEYDMVIDGPDHLPTASRSVDLDGTSENFSTQGADQITPSITLVEGDIDADDLVGPSDISALRTAFGNGADPSDLDEDMLVGPSDISLLRNNFGESGRFTSRSTLRGPVGASTIRLNPDRINPVVNGNMYFIDVLVSTGNTESTNVVQLHVRYDTAILRLDAGIVGSGFGACNPACDFENKDIDEAGPQDVGFTTLAANEHLYVFSSNEQETGTDIRVAQLVFTAIADAPPNSTIDVQIIDGDSTPGVQSGTLYSGDDGVVTSRAAITRQFANCDAGVCGNTQLAVGLDSSNVAPSASPLFVILTFAVLAAGSIVGISRKKTF